MNIAIFLVLIFKFCDCDVPCQFNQNLTESSNVTCSQPTDADEIIFHFITNRSVLLISICTTIILMLITIIIIVCCFWSKCPLYMICRIKYKTEDVIAYERDEEGQSLFEMPPEEQKGVTIYSPNAVKITYISDE